MIGRTISHYLVLEELGRGGMGVVYKSRDTHLDRFVAIKVLPPDKVADPERKRRFAHEAKAASALNHPRIVTIYDIDNWGGVDFIAMEFIEGSTLRRLITPGGMDLPAALAYSIEMADALAAAHRSGIVHRDLKPANVMVNSEGHVKILDFGLAKLVESAPVSDPAGTTATKAGESTLTREGAIVGTVDYMSPEQVEGRKPDARSDIFSFGLVLYEMLTGRRAFGGDSAASTMSAILRDSVPPPRKLRPEIPAELENILNRCLEKSRDQRYASGAELHRDLIALERKLSVREMGFAAFLRKP